MAYRRKAKPALTAARSTIIGFELRSRLRTAFAVFSWRYVYFFQMVTIGGVVAASAKGVKPYSARSVLSTL